MIITITFIIYFIVLLVVGFIAYMRTRNLSDYILGGRRLGSFVTALSAEASDMSGWLLLGLPGYAYAAGYEAGWIALGLFIGTYLNWLLIAPKLRMHPAATGESLTLADYFEKRFNDSSRLLRIIIAFFTLIFFLFYTSSGLVAGGKLFNSVFGIPYVWAVLLGAFAIIIYTFMGGFLAVCWTDCIQGMLMFMALLIVPAVAIESVGGWQATQDAMHAINPSLLNPFKAIDGSTLSVMAIISLMGWGLGYFGQPHILARFMAIRTHTQLPAARRIAMVWVALSMFGALLVGFVGIGALPEPLLGADTEKVFIKLVELMLHPVTAGICLSAILAAIMSTADSQLLVSSSAFAEDFYKPFIRKKATQRELVFVGRMAVVVIAAAAFILALKPNSKVLELVAYAWAGFGASFGPALILSLFWKRMTRNAALAGIITGGLTVIIWKQLSGGIFDLYEIVPGFAFSMLVILIVSLAGNRDWGLGNSYFLISP
ncbi:MAG: sodium/proline symporter [Candidatus Fischerbacteria bacterium RBG_13_37_8]|uniref:Sodium/proline symporter n=1 Tax=Candidatus Fischerbacteria bacterium RBG_13_37_8 TaxID=1817863 RepID=A0A1F5VXC4_9BACT|nr:MAG: sodium/proline symporter [Candidatus Fischerbacteria bacterium RBG_13_37_8]